MTRRENTITRALLFLFFAFTVLFISFYSRERADSLRPLPIDVFEFQSAMKRALESEKLVLVDFYAARCEACRKMERVTYRDTRVSERIGTDFIFVRVNINDAIGTAGSLSGSGLAEKYSVRSVPTHILLDWNGNERGRFGGYCTPEEFLTMLDSVVSKQEDGSPQPQRLGHTDQR
jgi:thioredoxin-related protein